MAAFMLTIVLLGTAAPEPDKLNFVFILIDDLGWMDVGCYGSTFHETPHIDRLAAGGMRFTEAYAASPVCSPTRASIMSGKHPARLHITDWIGGRQKGLLMPAEYEHQLPLEEVTIAEALKEAGYATGFFGKWHLGEAPFYPEHQGFDVNVGGHHAGQPASYFHPYKGKKSSRWDVPGLEGGKKGEYLTDRLNREALKFMEEHREEPFLLFLSHYTVHTPIQSKPALKEKYLGKAESLPADEGPDFIKEQYGALTRQKQDRADYAGMVQSMDESVGRVTSKLEELGLSDRTVVIFMSDNGGLSTLSKRKGSPTCNLPLRAGKGWLYEGGIREPMVIKWPGVVKAGSVCREPVVSMDFYPTMLEMAGLDPRATQHKDGSSLVPLLKGGKKLDREALYFHFPHYHGSGNRPSGAVRCGNYKLIEWFEDNRVELYDLSTDTGEKNDLASSLPDKAEALMKRLHDWREEVGANMPK